MATPKSFETAGGNGNRSEPEMPRMELQDELRAISGEPGAPAAPSPAAAADRPPGPAEAGPQAKPAGQPVVRPVAATPPQPAVSKPAVKGAPKEPVVARAPAAEGGTEDLSEPLRIVVSLPRDEISPQLIRALTFLEDRSLAEIIEAVVRGYFEDRAEDERVRQVVEAWERYQTV